MIVRVGLSACCRRGGGGVVGGVVPEVIANLQLQHKYTGYRTNGNMSYKQFDCNESENKRG